jgi:hypothetical protein
MPFHSKITQVTFILVPMRAILLYLRVLRRMSELDGGVELSKLLLTDGALET